MRLELVAVHHRQPAVQASQPARLMVKIPASASRTATATVASAVANAIITKYATVDGAKVKIV
jgi:hypothetical protein